MAGGTAGPRVPKILNFGSACSGIEAASQAWHPLGWKAFWFSEIDPFPKAVLKARWPETPNLGDMRELHERREFNDGTIDLLVGGTPCQSFSVAGLRGGLDDPRGNLALEFLRLLLLKRPPWVLWENVPGVLSADKGKAFGTFLRQLGKCGYGWAYRVLDAQYFGIPQRRRRVFVVGYLGDWRPAVSVLFERQSLQGNTPPGRSKGQSIAPTIASRPSGGGGLGTDFDLDGGLVAKSLMGKRNDSCDPTLQTYITGPLMGSAAGTERTAGIENELDYLVQSNTGCFLSGGKTAGSATMQDAYNDLLILESQGGSIMNVKGDGTVGTLRANTKHHEPSILAPTLRAMPNQGPGRMADDAARMNMVRRLTPRECERLQGFPDDYTLVEYRGKLAADGPRYKALGNSMAVPCMRWLGQRIQLVATYLAKGVKA